VSSSLTDDKILVKIGNISVYEKEFIGQFASHSAGTHPKCCRLKDGLKKRI
jgi:hypothetical protein